MDIFEDYAEYMEEYQKIILRIKKSEGGVFVLIEDVIKVTDHIWIMHSHGDKIDDELMDIFEAGFGYLSNVLEELKVFLEEYFNNNLDTFKYYSPMIIYSIYIDDFKCHLRAEEKLTKDKEKIINNIIYEIDDIMVNKKPFAYELIDSYDEIISQIKPKNSNYMPIYTIFSRIVEELDLI